MWVVSNNHTWTHSPKWTCLKQGERNYGVFWTDCEDGRIIEWYPMSLVLVLIGAMCWGSKYECAWVWIRFESCGRGEDFQNTSEDLKKGYPKLFLEGHWACERALTSCEMWTEKKYFSIDRFFTPVFWHIMTQCCFITAKQTRCHPVFHNCKGIYLYFFRTQVIIMYNQFYKTSAIYVFQCMLH